MNIATSTGSVLQAFSSIDKLVNISRKLNHCTFCLVCVSLYINFYTAHSYYSCDIPGFF